MSKQNLWKLLAVIALASMLLAACGGAAAGGEGGEKVTASGFVCPEPETQMEVTSKELNLFVWTDRKSVV